MSKQRTNTPMLFGIGTIVLAIGSLLISVPSLASAIFASGLNDQGDQDNLKAFLTSHEEDLDSYLDRFEGRSLFFRPKAPPIQRTIVKDTTPRVEVKKEPPGPPKNYTGPKVLGVYGNVVWFVNNLKIPLGEIDNGVKVLEINAPWSVKLEHFGGTYDVPVFSDRIIDSDEFSSPLKLKTTPGITYDEDNPAGSDNSGDNIKRERVRQ